MLRHGHFKKCFPSVRRLLATSEFPSTSSPSVFKIVQKKRKKKIYDKKKAIYLILQVLNAKLAWTSDSLHVPVHDCIYMMVGFALTYMDLSFIWHSWILF